MPFSILMSLCIKDLVVSSLGMTWSCYLTPFIYSLISVYCYYWGVDIINNYGEECKLIIECINQRSHVTALGQHNYFSGVVVSETSQWIGFIVCIFTSLLREVTVWSNYNLCLKFWCWLWSELGLLLSETLTINVSNIDKPCACLWLVKNPY